MGEYESASGGVATSGRRIPARSGTPARAATLALALACTAPAAALGQGDATAGCPPGLRVAVERPFAARQGIEVGDRLDLAFDPEGPGCTAVVAAIFEPAADPSRLTAERPRLLMSFPELARLAGRPDAADWITLALTGRADADAVAARLRATLPGLEVWSTAEVGERASTTFTVIERFHRAIAWITLVAGGAFLACVMFLKVEERRDAAAALRSMGISRATLARWIVLEGALVAVVGGAAGLGLGAVASLIVNRAYQSAYQTTLVFSLVTPGILWRSLALALLMGVGAGGLATARLLAAAPLTEIGRR